LLTLSDRSRPPSDQIPYATRLDSVRHPIGFRSPSDQVPFAERPLTAYSFGTLYKAVDDNIKQNERQNIYHNYISDRYETIEYNVKYDKNNLQAENSNKRTMLRESTAQKLMMEMALIGLKDGLSVAQTRNDDTHHIETWHDEQRVGKKQTIAAEWHHIRVVHNKLNEQERKHETQRETARIAHKNLVFMFLSTIDIVI
jgi:hypothetical protein